MKHQAIVRFCIIVCLLTLQILTISASTYGPGLLFHKTYPTDPYHAFYYMSCTAGTTNQAYNEAGNVVPYLQEYGREDFLRRFIDPSLPPTDSQTLGCIDFFGTFNFQQLNIMFSKNIHHNLFMGIGTSIRNLGINSISADLQLDPDIILTPEEKCHLERFLSDIPDTINQSGIYSNYIEFGYNKAWKNFKAIDFLQLFLKLEMCTPQIMTGSYVAALQYPIGGNITFSYPLVAILSIGMLEHVTMGVYGMIIPLQSREVSLPVNRSDSRNEIILTESTLCRVNPKPIFSATWYMELYDIAQKYTASFGYGYTHGMAWNVTAHNEREFPSDVINGTKLLAAFSITSMFFQFGYNFATEKNPRAPSFSFLYTMPIAGTLYPKINIFGGTYYLSINYPF